MLLVLVLAVPVQAATSDLTVVLTSQNPLPVEPGNNVEIEVQIQNNGLKEATNTIIEIVPKSPFTLLPGYDKVKTYNLIPAQGSVSKSYKLKVDDSVITESYNMEFRMY